MTEPQRGLPEPLEDGTDSEAAPPRRAADAGRFRWSLAWTALGTLIPGLGLWHAGRRVAGAVVMSVFAAMLLGLVYLGTAGRDRITTLATNVDVLNGVAVGLLVLAVVWVTIIATSHLALRPANPSASQRVAGGILVGVLSLAVAAPLAVSAEFSRSTAEFLGTVFSDDEPSADPTTSGAPGPTNPWGDKERINVLVLGGDSGTHRDPALGLRADTVMVASIDVRTGVSTLFSLPRQTARIPFPKDSPLHKYYPNGFYDGSNGANSDYFLNAMYNNIPPRIPRNLLGDKVKNLGAEVMKVGVGEALGLGKLDYYVIINMDGFKQFINALGGVTLNVNYRIPIGGKTTEGVPPTGYIDPGPNKHLDGRLALWYARGRYGLTTGDYSRMERQRCVINAVVQQATPQAVLTNFEKIASAGSKTIQTDIPRRMLPQMIDLALKVKNTNLHSVVFQPGVAGWVSSNPPWPAVQRRVQQALKEADKAESGKTGSPSAPTNSPSQSATAKPTKSSSSKSENLNDSCAYHPQK
ncbi:MAG: LCP family protein [Micropruina sp.]|uniref:LCP family protein n=1 Tax=Micropruina sp. TaxID=2737536 RepID=UPI0039E4F8C9